MDRACDTCGHWIDYEVVFSNAGVARAGGVSAARLHFLEEVSRSLLGSNVYDFCFQLIQTATEVVGALKFKLAVLRCSRSRTTVGIRGQFLQRSQPHLKRFLEARSGS